MGCGGLRRPRRPSATVTCTQRRIGLLVVAYGIGFIALFTGAIAERFIRPDVEHAAAEVEADDALMFGEISQIQARLEALLQSRRQA